MLPKADQTYLRDLAKQTWDCIAGLDHPTTGLPYDNSEKGEFTSVSNIGFYLSSVVAARHMELISQAEEEQRLAKCLDSLEKLEGDFGFQQSWNSVETLKPSPTDPWVSILDNGNLAAGLLTVAQAEPKVRDRCQALFDKMGWDKFYRASGQYLVGGYNRQTHAFNEDWKLTLLASDALLCQFFAVATGSPSSLWEHLGHDTETRNDLAYMKPGWEGGGLFMQFIAGIWLDNGGTPVGKSAANFARVQMRWGKDIGAPVWGWSASENPDGGYLGWGQLVDPVVTPHACVLAIEQMPTDVVANLRALEKLGARSKDQGFYDSVNWKTGKVAKKFLVLDQGMLFLSLANYLDGDVVRKWFQASQVVQKGRQALADYRR